MADQAEPAVPTPDPTTAVAPAAAPTPVTPTPDLSAASATPWAGSPWAEKLDGLQDGLTRQQVHELWQGEVQPYVTRKEQELGEVANIWNALNDEEQSLPTFLALAEQQYGPEVAQALAGALTQYVEQETTPAEGEVDWDSDAAYQQWYDAQPPWVQAQEDQRIAQEEDQTYEQEVQQYAPDVIADGTGHIFARYVSAIPDGDIQKAKALYDQEFGPVIAQAKQDPNLAASLGLQFGEQSTAPAVPTGAPTVLGATGAQGGTPPPTEPRYASLDDAMDDFWSEIKGTGPAALQRPE